MAGEKIGFEDLLLFIRWKAKNQNGGFLARFGTSDVVQECALQLVKEQKKTSSTEVDAPPSKALVKKVTSTVAAKLRRRHSSLGRGVRRESRSDTAHLVESNDPSDNIILRELSANLVLALSRLSDIQKRIIDFHYRRNLSLTKIAEALQLNPRYVQRQHQNALATLRNKIDSSD